MAFEGFEFSGIEGDSLGMLEFAGSVWRGRGKLLPAGGANKR
jgi:hypothetical protein